LPPRISKALALALKSLFSRRTTSARRSPAPLKIAIRAASLAPAGVGV
jgi:hypothetical protein